jgi:endonuclease III
MAKKTIDSAELGIDVRSREETELFKWFLACLLFGKPIQQAVVKRTYGEFIKEGFLTPKAILQAGWDKLVEVLDRGHYVRYDFSTATKLLDVCQALLERYGSVTNLLAQSRSPSDLSRRLQVFKGVGPVTARIFLRDIKSIWPCCKSGKGRGNRERAEGAFAVIPGNYPGPSERTTRP